MKKLLLFAVVATLFAACTQEVTVDVTNPSIADDAPETLTMGFEGDDTRIQLNEAQKTVWTKDDLVSVFYRSNANQKWQYQGKTGERTAVLKRVDAGNATETMKRVVVVYPYNKNYYINTETYNVQASLPAVQHYLKDSYGLDGNIMISSAEYNDVTLKNVCGWLKLQLTGNGEVVRSIKFRGNNGEQVAGELYINSADATAILASDMGNIAEDEGENATGGAGANLSFDDVVLKEVTLDCGEGVELGAEATTFYIALPPQTFEKGFTVDMECDGSSPKPLSTENALTIERNHIQPMASVKVEPTSGYENDHEWIDLGLSVKWATCNVGATTPEDYGDYFAWGEVAPKDEYTIDNCVTYGRGMEDISGNPMYDAATANWGGNWRMPTSVEEGEILLYCTYNWTSQNGINGMQITGPNGNSIFLPAAGSVGSSLYDVGSRGNYWNSTPWGTSSFYFSFELYKGSCNIVRSWDNRSMGKSVRPVLD